MHTSFSYYDILGVSTTAATGEIKVAYHAAILKYHPDVNTAPNAQRLTELINDAYAVLSDEAKRRAYDQSLAAGQSPNEPGEASDETWDFFACDGCGKVDVHIRFVMFFRVFSLIFYSQMNGAGGILCPDCRNKLATSTALFSAFLGPWGFPWGIFYTIRSLFASLRGGEQPRAQNAQLLRHQGIAFLQRGFVNEARTTLMASLTFERNDSVSALLNEPVFAVSTVFPGPRWSSGQTIAGALFAVPPIVIALLIMWMGSGSTTTSGDASSSQASSTADQSQAIQESQLKGMIHKCAQAQHQEQDARSAYDACDAALKWLADDIKATSAGSEDHQNYSLIIDEALLFKSDAASRLGWTDESKQLRQQGLDDLETLRDKGATADVRNAAKRYYDCAANGVCAK